MLKIDLGCGRNRRKGYVGVDASEYSESSHMLDIGCDEFPFEDESVDKVYTHHTLEHLTGEELIHCMNECWRVMKWNAKMFIHVPEMTCDLAWQDPTHKSFFVPDSIKFFTGIYPVKYRLDYGIRCAFIDYEILRYYPKGKENKDYCTMLQYSLRKDRSRWYLVSPFYPFGVKTPPSNLEEFRVDNTDPKVLARGGELIGGSNFRHRHRVDEEIPLPIKPRRPKETRDKFDEKLIEVAKYAFNNHRNKILDIYRDAKKRYGDEDAPLGEKGLFADLNRKHRRLKRFLWEGVEDTSENIFETLYDNVVYSIRAVMYLERKYGKDSEREDNRS